MVLVNPRSRNGATGRRWRGHEARLREVLGPVEVETTRGPRDAERLRRYGVRVEAIKTGGGCHLDAHGVAAALAAFDPRRLDLLFIENVGNLVCPSAYDLGETMKIVRVSLAEEEDKPLKYPAAFLTAGALVVTKIDLAPQMNTSAARIIANARSLQPELLAFPTSCFTGEGLEDWTRWLTDQVAARRAMARPIGAEPTPTERG